MKKFRCTCGRLLAKIDGDEHYKETSIPKEIVPYVTDNTKEIDKDNCIIEIKCPKCKELNQLAV